MTANPPLSHTMKMTLWPDSTVLNTSELAIRYEPSPMKARTSPPAAREVSANAMLAPHAPDTSYPMVEKPHSESKVFGASEFHAMVSSPMMPPAAHTT